MAKLLDSVSPMSVRPFPEAVASSRAPKCSLCVHSAGYHVRLEYYIAYFMGEPSEF